MAITPKKTDAGALYVTSIVSGRTFEPLVELQWGDRSCQMDLEEARQHALGILEAAEAAESDAFVFKWLMRDIVGTAQDDSENFQQVISEFKMFREARVANGRS